MENRKNRRVFPSSKRKDLLKISRDLDSVNISSDNLELLNAVGFGFLVFIVGIIAFIALLTF